MHFSYSCTQSTTIHDLGDMQDEKRELSVNTATLVWKHESSFKNKALSVGP